MPCQRLTFIVNMAAIADQKNLVFHARAECADCCHLVLGQSTLKIYVKKSKIMIKGKAEKTIKSKEDCEESAVEGNKVEIACSMQDGGRRQERACSMVEIDEIAQEAML